MPDTQIKTDHVNEYVSKVERDYKFLPEEEKEIIRKAFEAGREYERSLFSDVLATIVSEVKRYREASR